MWNNTDIPLAYLITFRCYGTWLHSDERGSTDRFHNQYKSPHVPANEQWRQFNVQQMVGAASSLTAAHRAVIESAIRDTYKFRNWELHALNIRTNHVHVVISIGAKPPERSLNAFKANATRLLREAGLWTSSHSPWADKGSTRYLWNNLSVERAIDYVINGQGEVLPDFD